MKRSSSKDKTKAKFLKSGTGVSLTRRNAMNNVIGSDLTRVSNTDPPSAVDVENRFSVTSNLLPKPKSIKLIEKDELKRGSRNKRKLEKEKEDSIPKTKIKDRKRMMSDRQVENMNPANAANDPAPPPVPDPNNVVEPQVAALDPPRKDPLQGPPPAEENDPGEKRDQPEEDAKKAEEDAMKAEEAKRAAEDAKKAEEDAMKAEEAKRAAEDAKKAEDDAKKAEEAKRAAEDAKKAEDDAKKAEEAKRAAEDAKKAEDDAKKAAEDAKKAEEAKRAEDDAKKVEEDAKKVNGPRKEDEHQVPGLPQVPVPPDALGVPQVPAPTQRKDPSAESDFDPDNSIWDRNADPRKWIEYYLKDYAKTTNQEQFYAMDKDGNQFYHTDKGYASKIFDDGIKRFFIEYPPTNKDGQPIYIRNEYDAIVYPSNTFGEPVFPVDENGDQMYIIDPETNQEQYPIDHNGNPVYARTKNGVPIIIGNERDFPIYGTNKSGWQIYPRNLNGDEMYAIYDNKEIPALNNEFEPYYAKKHNGDEIYPRLYCEENENECPIDLDINSIYNVKMKNVGGIMVIEYDD